MLQVLSDEFDLKISKVLLAHECVYPVEQHNEVYNKGRLSFGMVYAVSGRAKYICADKNIIAEKGDILFLQDKSKYIVETYGDKQFHHYTVNFLMEDFDSEKLSIQDICVLKTKNEPFYKNLFFQMASVWNDKKCGYNLMTKACLYEILQNFFAEIAKQGQNQNDVDRILPAKKHLDEFYMREVSVKELSAMCGISTTHFRRLFKSLYLRSPLEYRLNLRILKAKDLLLLKMYSINEVSEMTGFSDSNYFSRVFKEKVGVSPLKFKIMY